MWIYGQCRVLRRQPSSRASSVASEPAPEGDTGRGQRTAMLPPVAPARQLSQEEEDDVVLRKRKQPPPLSTQVPYRQ